MSQFSFPRIHFKGEVIVNVGTANNDDRMMRPLVNGAQVKLVFVPVNPEEAEFVQQGKKEAEFVQQMMKVQPLLRSGWNYFGDNDIYFENTVVTGVQLDYDKLLKDDPLVGASVSLNDAVIVDINSQGSQGVQIFADEFAIRGQAMMCGGQPTPSYSRWTHFYRNLGAINGFERGGAIFQSAIPKARMLPLQVGNSPALAAMYDALDKPEGLIAQGDDGGVPARLPRHDKAQGLMLRISMYFVKQQLSEEKLAEKFFVKPQLEDKELAEKLMTPQRWENPAIGRIVGTLAPWYADELTSVTMGRLLLSRDPTGQALPVRLPQFSNFFLGPAVAAVDKLHHRVSLDLVNTFPEQNDQQDKFDCGNVTLQVTDGQTLHAINTVPYRKQDYEDTAGLVDIPYDAELDEVIDSGLLFLKSDNPLIPAPLLLETPHMVETDDRCFYMQEGETRHVKLHALNRGKTAFAPFAVEILTTDDPDTTTQFLQQAGYKVEPAEVVKIAGLQEMMITPGKPATVALEALNPGSALVFFRPAGEHEPQPSLLWDCYINLRVLPKESYDHIPDEALTHEFIYKEVLCYYQLLHPGMNKVFSLKDKNQWTPRRAEILLERMKPEMRERYGYMPRTRDLSEGKRELLERWCRKIIRLDKPV